MQRLEFWRAALLRKTREEHGVTQEQLAKKAGIKRSYIADVETGRDRLATDEAKQVWDALAALIANKEGDFRFAASVALEAARADLKFREELVERIKREIEDLPKKLEALEGNVKEAQVDIERLEENLRGYQ